MNTTSVSVKETEDCRVAMVNSSCAEGSLGQPRSLPPWEQDSNTMTTFPARASSLAFLADQRAAGAQFWLLSTVARVGTLQFCM